MRTIDQTEHATQNRVITLFTDAMNHTYLSNGKGRAADYVSHNL
jgi:hypothetical protein